MPEDADRRRELQLQGMIVQSAKITRDLVAKADAAEAEARRLRHAAMLSAENGVDLQRMYREAYCETTRTAT